MKALIIIMLLLLSNYSFSQKNKENQLAREAKNLLSNTAFSKMITQDVTYTIFGESAPTSGIKVDVSKPQGSISGVFRLKEAPSILIGLDFKGGISDNNFSIFKGFNNFNTSFELKAPIYFITKCNTANYWKHKKPFIRAKNQLYERTSQIQMDTFLVAALLYNHHIDGFKDFIDINKNIPNDSPSNDNPAREERQKQILISLIKGFTNKNYEKLVVENTFEEILSVVEQVRFIAHDSTEKKKGDTIVYTIEYSIDIDTYNEGIFNTYQKYKKLYGNNKAKKLDVEIKNANEAWTQKNFYWFSLSPTAKTQKANLYHIETDSSYINSDYYFSYGINASFNILILKFKKLSLAHYFQFDLNLSHSNNLSTLSTTAYETRDSLFSYGNSYTEKKETGLAYDYEKIKSGFLTQIKVEYYLLPLKSAFPGVYVSSSLNISPNLYKTDKFVGRENHHVQVSLEGGPVFNINSREKNKEKNLLSIAIYVRFQDLTDWQRTEKKEDGELEEYNDYLDRNLGFGFKVGIPITLPKKTK